MVARMIMQIINKHDGMARIVHHGSGAIQGQDCKEVNGWEDSEQACFESLCIHLASRSFTSQSKADTGCLTSCFWTWDFATHSK